MPVADFSGGGNTGNGVAFLIAGGLVYEIIAFACSSPQTAEINIRKREGTLMKWVHLGQALGAVTIIIAATIDPQHRGAIVAGGVFAMASAEGFYMHARASGLSKPAAPETENY
jgi:hypothetical protein